MIEYIQLAFLIKALFLSLNDICLYTFYMITIQIFILQLTVMVMLTTKYCTYSLDISSLILKTFDYSVVPIVFTS